LTARATHLHLRRRQTSDVQILVAEEQVNHGQQFTARTIKRKVFTGRWIHFTSHFGIKTKTKEKKKQNCRKQETVWSDEQQPATDTQLAVRRSRNAVNM